MVRLELTLRGSVEKVTDSVVVRGCCVTSGSSSEEACIAGLSNLIQGSKRALCLVSIRSDAAVDVTMILSDGSRSRPSRVWLLVKSILDVVKAGRLRCQRVKVQSS